LVASEVKRSGHQALPLYMTLSNIVKLH